MKQVYVLIVAVLLLVGCDRSSSPAALPLTPPPATSPTATTLWQHIDVGMEAPGFTLTASDGTQVRLEDATRTGPVVLVFYLNYACSKCVLHLRDINDHINEFKENGATVYGISLDTPQTTREASAANGAFAFTLLSDSDNKVARDYGVILPDGTPMHGVFIIDTDRSVRFAMISSKPYDHTAKLIEVLASLKGTRR